MLAEDRIRKNWDNWLKISQKVKGYCIKKFRPHWEDLCHEAAIKFVKENTLDDEKSNYSFALYKVWESAREKYFVKKLERGGETISVEFISLEEMMNNGFEPSSAADSAAEKELHGRMRLKEVMEHPLISPKVQNAIGEILDGRMAKEAASKIGMKENTLTMEFQRAGQIVSNQQLGLFKQGVHGSFPKSH